MFVVLSYDINKKRVSKALKICRKYLVHQHNSVFEGEITEAKLNKLKEELKKMMVPEQDGICIYKMESTKYTTKEQIGKVEVHDNII